MLQFPDHIITDYLSYSTNFLFKFKMCAEDMSHHRLLVSYTCCHRVFFSAILHLAYSKGIHFFLFKAALLWFLFLKSAIQIKFHSDHSLLSCLILCGLQGTRTEWKGVRKKASFPPFSVSVVNNPQCLMLSTDSGRISMM